MSFTALHRALGRPAGPVTDELLDEAVANGVAETDDLDWKRKLPETRNLSQAEFPKDIAAMANSGGGLLVYGVKESQKKATGRVDVGELTEGHERTLRAAAMSAIVPPVPGLIVHRLEAGQKRAFAIEVPASLDRPHLIFRNEMFGAPMRNDADTVWMNERQLEAMYRARFEERRHSAEALDTLYAEAKAGHDLSQRAWFIAVAHPRIPTVGTHLSPDEALQIAAKATTFAGELAGTRGPRPLISVNALNPRPGLRRWVFPARRTGETNAWHEAWASVHHDGSVTLSAAVGGWRSGSNSFLAGYEVNVNAVELAVADLMAMVRTTAQATGNVEYDVRVGIVWDLPEQLMIVIPDDFDGADRAFSTPLGRYTPVETTVDAAPSDHDFHRRVYDLATDCINQGGISEPALIKPSRPT